MIKDNPRCLIGTLYAGESEIDACETVLREQKYANWDHFRLDHLAEQKAHEKLYEIFMENKNDFDLFLKIDADMVLINQDVLGNIIKFIQKRPNLDHACFTVHDYMTNLPIWGLHVFTNQVEWKKPKSRFFPDQDPIVSGAHLMVRNAPAPVAYHAPNPTPYQAFHFGTHRMFKALNAETLNMECYQLNIIYQIACHAKYNKDPRLRLALLGAWHVWNGDIGSNANEVADYYKQIFFAQYANASTSVLEQFISYDWLKILAKHKHFKRFYYILKQRAEQTIQDLRSRLMVSNRK